MYPQNLDLFIGNARGIGHLVGYREDDRHAGDPGLVTDSFQLFKLYGEPFPFRSPRICQEVYLVVQGPRVLILFPVQGVINPFVSPAEKGGVTHGVRQENIAVGDGIGTHLPSVVGIGEPGIGKYLYRQIAELFKGMCLEIEGGFVDVVITESQDNQVRL